MVQHCSDRGKIVEYREALKQSLDIFGVCISVLFSCLWLAKPQSQLNSTISICDNITTIIHKQDKLAKQLQEQRSQDSELKGLLTEVLERSLQEKKAAALIPSSPSPPTPDHTSRNPFLKSCSNFQSLHAALPSHPRQFYITGNYVSSDTSHTVKNMNSGNTTITNTSSSHNDSSVKIVGTRSSHFCRYKYLCFRKGLTGRRGRYSHSSF